MWPTPHHRSGGGVSDLTTGGLQTYRGARAGRLARRAASRPRALSEPDTPPIGQRRQLDGFARTAVGRPGGGARPIPAQGFQRRESQHLKSRRVSNRGGTRPKCSPGRPESEGRYGTIAFSRGAAEPSSRRTNHEAGKGNEWRTGSCLKCRSRSRRERASPSAQPVTRRLSSFGTPTRADSTKAEWISRSPRPPSA